MGKYFSRSVIINKEKFPWITINKYWLTKTRTMGKLYLKFERFYHKINIKYGSLKSAIKFFEVWKITCQY